MAPKTQVAFENRHLQLVSVIRAKVVFDADFSFTTQLGVSERVQDFSASVSEGEQRSRTKFLTHCLGARTRFRNENIDVRSVRTQDGDFRDCDVM